jgi:hypothetical protein
MGLFSFPVCQIRRKHVAKVYGSEVLERVRTRRHHAARRQRARETATGKVAKALNALIDAGAPADFDSEEAHAFMSTVRGHRLRMVGYGSPARFATIKQGTEAALATMPSYDECEWDPRYSKEDFEELRRLGHGVADWRLK